MGVGAGVLLVAGAVLCQARGVRIEGIEIPRATAGAGRSPLPASLAG